MATFDYFASKSARIKFIVDTILTYPAAKEENRRMDSQNVAHDERSSLARLESEICNEHINLP